MEIVSFEPYHIGIKLLPHVNLGVLEGKLRRVLKEKGFEGTEKPVVELPVKFGPPIEVVGVKNDVRIELHIPASALNTIGEKPEIVMAVFEEINTILPELNYDLKATVAFYEILANILIKSKKRPVEMINKALKINLEPLKEIGEVVVDSFRIINISPKEEESSLRMIVEPNPNNPDSMYLVRLSFQSPKMEKIASFHNELQSRILKTINSLE
ncbi:MAG: hypothetical protein ACUVXA_20020 [Candidatus Jordarchaeum sp.]|uniref:hypothetical protein n=1 Tax=Candidatus Jordarchaeum sp. TaxID=2823881 RepID=UPI0040493A73